MKTNFFEALNEFVTDVRFRTLAVTQNFESYLGAHGMNEAENMHTFGWLLDPRGSHGLRDTYLREFMLNAWTMIHGQYGKTSVALKESRYYTGLSPVALQSRSFASAHIDRTYGKTHKGCDMVITDIDSKTMIVINNRYEEAVCKDLYSHFASAPYAHFEHKLFVTFSAEAQSINGQWMYMNNDWLIGLTEGLLASPQYANEKVTGTLREFYQFLTGCQYGTSHEALAEASAGLVADYYDVICDLRNFRAEKISTVALTDICPREYATSYIGKLSDSEYGILSLYWAYRNTFQTFFQLCDLEGVTRDVTRMIEKKPYRFDRSFVRNGLRFTPSFERMGSEMSFFNTIFDLEAVVDHGKNLSMNLVVNKSSWDRLTASQRETIQKNFGWTGVVLSDRVIVWNAFYRQDWMKKDLGSEIVSVFERVNSWASSLGIKAA